MSGQLHLVGTGPGDPDLMTLKAKHVLAEADCIAFPQKPGETSLALGIAETALNPEAERLPIDMPIAVERGPAQAAYDVAAAEIEKRLKAGKSVAYLCEGDPLFYGSAMYLLDRLKPLVAVHVVPGVTSVSASAAAIQRPLAARNEVFKVLPAPLADAALESELRGAESVALIKIGRHLPRIRALLERTGHLKSAMVVSGASRGDETVTPLAAVTGDSLPYFSTILAYAGNEAWADELKPDRHFAGSPAQPPEPVIASDGPAKKPAVILFTTAGAAIASQIATATGGRVLAFGPGEEGAATLLPRLFAEGTPIVGVCAAGILIRLLADSLQNKRNEPPVIAVSADGAHVVPLLGGHHGGNALARELAEALGGQAAVTTASDARFSRGLDEPPAGFVHRRSGGRQERHGPRAQWRGSFGHRRSALARRGRLSGQRCRLGRRARHPARRCRGGPGLPAQNPDRRHRLRTRRHPRRGARASGLDL